MLRHRIARRLTRLFRAHPVMTDAEFVTAVYGLALGRRPDAAGHRAWLKVLASTGDPTSVVAGIIASDEARQRRDGGVSFEDVPRLVERALTLLARAPRIVDVGAQTLGEGTHPYSPLEGMTPLDIIGFDPLAARLDEREEREHRGGAEGSMTLLPYAIGDGGVHTLYINNDDSTSSLFALNVGHNAVFNHLSTLTTVREERVTTHPLDDVLQPGPIDLLKIDVQGAALMVLKGATASLARTAVVHCEAEFSPIYLGQPLYPEIQTELAASGFYLVDLLVPGRYHYLTKSGAAAPDRLLWADAVFFRESDDVDVLAAQALMAAAIYAKPTLAEHLLARAEER